MLVVRYTDCPVPYQSFFSVNGWHLPVVGGLLGLWILAASVALLRRN